jgi:hypothetical protein
VKASEPTVNALNTTGGRPLPFGRMLHVDAALGTVHIANPDGLVELSVRCTAEGCVLSFASAQLALATSGRLDVRCRELVVEAEQRLELNSGGDFTSRIGGCSTTTVSGRLETDADEMFLHTQRGDALIQANDYVRLVGEKVLLNSEQERRPVRNQLEAFWRGVGL